MRHGPASQARGAASGETCPDNIMESRNENQTIANEREGLNSPERPENRQLVISPVAIQTARAFIAWTQPHLVPLVEAAFAIGVQTGEGTLLGVALIGWPAAESSTTATRPSSSAWPPTAGPTSTPGCWARHGARCMRWATGA